jgi:hypothetical protein
VDIPPGGWLRMWFVLLNRQALQCSCLGIRPRVLQVEAQ